MTSRMRRKTLALLLGACVCLARPNAAHAQALESNMTAACVGGAIGCQQVDFFLSFVGLTSPAMFDVFTISLLSPGWTFDGFQEAKPRTRSG